MSDAVVTPTSPPILHRDETADHLKFIRDYTYEQLQIMKKGANKALANIGKPKRRTPEDLSIFDDLGISAKEMKESTKELKKSTIKASLAQNETIKETKKIHEAFIKSLGTYEMDIKNYAKTGGPKSLLKKYIEKRENEIFNNYSKLKESVGDSMDVITDGVKGMTKKQREAAEKAIEVITADMKRVTAEDKLFIKKEKDDKRKEKKEKREKTLENIFDKTLNAVLGPLHLIVDPLQEFLGKEFGEKIKEKFGLFGREQRNKKEKSIGELFEDTKSKKVRPTRNAILMHLPFGPAWVFLGDKLDKLAGKKKEGEAGGEEGKGGILQSLFGGAGAGAILSIAGWGILGAAMIGGIATALIAGWDKIAPEISKGLLDAFKGTGDKLKDFFTIAMYPFEVFFGSIAGGIRKAFEGSVGWIIDLWGDPNNKNSIISKILETVGGIISIVMNPTKLLTDYAKGAVETFAKFIWGLVPDTFGKFIENLFKSIQDSMAKFFKPITDIFDALRNTFDIKKIIKYKGNVIQLFEDELTAANSTGPQKEAANNAAALNNPPKVSEAYTKAGAGLAAMGGNTTMVIQEVKERWNSAHRMMKSGSGLYEPG